MVIYSLRAIPVRWLSVSFLWHPLVISKVALCLYGSGNSICDVQIPEVTTVQPHLQKGEVAMDPIDAAVEVTNRKSTLKLSKASLNHP
jgi:hypothetical protein